MGAKNRDKAKKNVGRYRHDPLFRDKDGDLILFLVNQINWFFKKKNLAKLVFFIGILFALWFLIRFF